MKLNVISDHILLAPIDPRVTTGGIVIPDAHMDDVANRFEYIRDSNQFVKARVVAVHGGRQLLDEDGYVTAIVPCDVEVGRFVIYRRAEAAPCELRDPETGVELVIVHEESCLGYVDENCQVERVTNRDRDGT